jgi:hypothetical protein
MDQPYIVLGNFPFTHQNGFSTFEAEQAFQMEFATFCSEKGWSAREWEVRDPKRNEEIINLKPVNGLEPVTIWHQDGFGGESINLIVWSSHSPTLIQLPNGEVIRPQSEQVVVFNNLMCRHMMPPKIENIDSRWFIRGWNAKHRSDKL